MSDVFEAFALPRHFDGTSVPLESIEGAGRTNTDRGLTWVTPRLDAGLMRTLCQRLIQSGVELRRRKALEIADVLGGVGSRFLDPGDELRSLALELVERTAAVSGPMAEVILDGMASDWTGERLRKLLSMELEQPAVLDGFVTLRGRRVSAHAPALCAQVVAGSVPGVTVTALIRSLLVKAPTLVKPGLADVALAVLFARALRDVDADLADALAVVYWRGGDEGVERAALELAEVAVVYGSDETVSAIRNITPPTARVVGYHHRLGVGLVGRDLEADEAEAVAADVARAVAVFEQRGCVCPQLLYVEEGGAISPAAFFERLARALRSVEVELPGAFEDATEAVALHQLRGSAEMWAATGEGEVIHGGGEGGWTAIYEPGGQGISGSVGRCIRIRPLTDAKDLAERLAPFARHLQSFGMAGAGARTDEIARALAAAGVSRIVPFARLAFPPPWWLHDGRGPLRELVRWTELEQD